MADIPSWDDTQDVEPSWDSTSDVAVADIPDSGGGLPRALSTDDWDALRLQSEARDKTPFQTPQGIKEIAKFAWEGGNEQAANSPIGLPAKALALVPRVEAQTVQDAYDAIARPLDEPSRPPSMPAQVIAGSVNVGRGVGDSLVSPLGVSTLGMGALPSIGQKAITGAFLADMATHLPEQARVAGEASVTGTPQEKVEAFGNLGVTPLFAAAMGSHLAAPVDPAGIVRAEPPIIREAVKAGSEAGLSKSVEALEQAAKAEPVSAPEVKPPVTDANVLGTPPVADFASVKSTENAWDFGRSRQTPEGIAELESIQAQIGQQLESIKADPAMAPMDKLNARAAIVSGPAHFIKEAISAAKNEQNRPAMTEYFQREVSKPVEPVKVAETAEEPTVTLYRGQQGAGAGGDYFSLNPEYAAKSGKEVFSVEVPKSVVDAGRAELLKTGNATKDAVLLPDEWQLKAKPVEVAPKVEPIDLTPEPVVEPALAEAGMGGMKPGERLKAPLAAVTESLKGLPEGTKSIKEAFEVGKSLSPIKDTAVSALEGLKAAGEFLKKKFEGKPEWNSWKEAIGGRHLELSESAINARRFVQEAKKKIPSEVDRAALSNWIDTGGDAATLARAKAETPSQYKAGYERAENLSPDQKVLAENLKQYLEKRLEDAQKAGILEDGVENYLHRIYEKDSNFKKGAIAELRSGLFAGKPALAKKRIYEYDFEAEKAGLKPVKDVIQRIAQYDLALNKAIADRKAVKAMMEIKMPDGRPMIDVGGGGKVIEAPTGEAEATLINRSAKKIDESDPVANRGDFKPYDHPALRKWKWAVNDAQGNPVFVQGDVLIHPDAIKQIDSLLGRSRIRSNPIGRGALGVSSTVKQSMLDLSGFHQVQIGVHGFEHKTFKPVKEIDFTDPDVRGLVKGGAVVGETSGHGLFSEGVAGSSLTKHIPWLGKRIQAYQSYLFGDYIPRLKMAMGLHALERNRERFPNLDKNELYHLTANQMNAAFGELNYEMMGRSKTMQDALRLTLLAPDFLEARGRFTAQGATKYGSEQRNALLLGAATMYVTARIMNKILDDEYHFEPKNAFNIVYKGKSYGLRTVQGDLIHAVTDPGKFANHRLNPLTGKPALEALTGRDYFGRKRDLSDKLKDLAATPIPISLRGLFSGREQTLLESFLNSFGFVTKRDSPASELSKLADEWREKNKVKPVPGEFIYDADKDPYRKIKLAADYYDVAAVRSEIDKALKEGLTKAKILNHFRLSANRKFTGSVANERKFLDSLTTDQRDQYRKAQEERRKIKEAVEAALR